ANASGAFGKVARVVTQFFTTTAVTTLDLTAVDSSLKGFLGGFSDGRYAYFVPNNNGAFFGKVARVDTQNFTTGGVTVLDLSLVDTELTGFWGGFTDGRYAYFVPNENQNGPSGKLARVDLNNFTTSGVTFMDLTTLDPALKGFSGGFTDGRFGFLVPNNNGTFSGRAARIQLYSGAGAP
ncbi:MAG: hypothetical protein HYR71_10340, partial [Chloroflexi bacterium]|nr:hypothetical protein [Chloroflexota bacterium]